MTQASRVGTGTQVIGAPKPPKGKGGTLVQDPGTFDTIIDEKLNGSLDATLAGPTSLAAPSSLGPASLFRTTVLPSVEMDGESVALVRKDRPRYQRQSLLGEGGVGEVVRTKDNDIERTVAIKRLKVDMRGASHLARFVDEIRTIGSMEHPNIVPIHDVGVDEEGQYFFVMKYVQGETLESIMEKLGAGDPLYHARYGFERRVEIFLGILEAIAYAHDRGVIHRDIKPANVMVGPFGEVTVMDWGLARKIRDERPEIPAEEGVPDRPGLLRTRVGTLLGTPAYMSPEQARGEVLDERSDIYSLTVLFHEFLSLQHYLHDATDLETMLHGVQHRKATPPSFIPSVHQPPAPMDLAHYVNKGIHKDPKDRYQTVRAMIDRLRRRAEGDIPIECHITFLKRTTYLWSKFVDRHPFVMTAMMVLSVLGTVGAIGWAVFGRRVLLKAQLADCMADSPRSFSGFACT